jgi:cold shock CspA family protein
MRVKSSAGARQPKKGAHPVTPNGRPGTGRIVTIWSGQGSGFIRLRNGREVYFHRADLQEGTAFRELQVGDSVTFELLEDAISGARAVRVVRARRSR